MHFQAFDENFGVGETSGDKYIFLQSGQNGVVDKTTFEKSVTSAIKPYEFARNKDISKLKPASFLEPPDGNNLYAVVFNNPTLRESVSELVNELGYDLTFDSKTRSFTVERRIGDTCLLFPYVILPDTLQALIFHSAIVYSNKDSFIILDENYWNNIFFVETINGKTTLCKIN